MTLPHPRRFIPLLALAGLALTAPAVAASCHHDGQTAAMQTTATDMGMGATQMSAAPMDNMAQMGSATVLIAGFAFQPAFIQIAPGTTVTWVNQDAAPHTVSSDNGSFDSGTLPSGTSFSLTFQTPGTYTYHCNIHPMMTGTVVVSGM